MKIYLASSRILKADATTAVSIFCSISEDAFSMSYVSNISRVFPIAKIVSVICLYLLCLFPLAISLAMVHLPI